MKNVWSIIALILVIIGGLNWMVVGIFNFNVVDWVYSRGTCRNLHDSVALFRRLGKKSEKGLFLLQQRLKKYDRKRSYFFVQTLDKAAEKVYIRIKLKFFGAR